MGKSIIQNGGDGSIQIAEISGDIVIDGKRVSKNVATKAAERICPMCHCELEGIGGHYSVFQCRTALMKRVERLETELARMNEKIKRFKAEFIR